MKKIFLLVILSAIYFSSTAQWFNWEARMGNTGEEMQAMTTEMSGKGFTPGTIHTIYHEGSVKYSSIWRQYPLNAAWQYRSNLTVQGLQEMADEFSGRGYVPVDVSVYKVNGETRYTALWSRDENTPFQSWTGIRAMDLKEKIDEFTEQGYRLTDIDGYVENGERYFSCIWKRFSDLPWRYVFGYDENAFRESIREAENDGFVPTAINVFEESGRPVYSAVYVNIINEKSQVKHNISETGLQSLVDEMVEEGYAITDVDSYIVNDNVKYALVFTKAIQQNPVQGPITSFITDESPVQVYEQVSVSRQLPIAPVRQQTLVWCWLAVGEMVFKHYGISNLNPNGNYQCGIIGSLQFVSPACASNCFNNACIIPSGSNYNTARMLRDYSWTAENKVFSCVEGREMSFNSIKSNIDMGKPIIAGVSYFRRQYYGGAEHAVLITGYERNESGIYLTINDPFPYEPGRNPYLNEGGTRLQENQYRMSLRDFTERIFWHWSLSTINIQ